MTLDIREALCGFRVPGKAYLTVDPEDIKKVTGNPALTFILDPVIPLPNWRDFMSPIGQTFIPICYDQAGNEVLAMYDWIGETSPNAVDTIQEYLQIGLSFKTSMHPGNSQGIITTMSTLDRVNVIYVVHPKAWLDEDTNKALWKDRKLVFGKLCLWEKPEHSKDKWPRKQPLPHCTTLLWEAIEPDRHNNHTDNSNPRLVARDYLWKYNCAELPENCKPTYTPGVLIALPAKNILKLDVISDPIDHTDEQLLSILNNIDSDIEIRIAES